MDEIRSVVQRAGTRLMIVDFFRAVVLLGTVALSALVLARIAQKLFPFELPWSPIFIGAGIGVLVVALVITVVRRKGEHAVAREVDQRAGLRATLGTAMFLGKPQGAWDHNVVNNAKETAKKVNVNQAVPMVAPARWPVPVALGLALLTVWWLPTYDVTGLMSDKTDRPEDENTIQEVKTQIEQQEKKLETMAKKVGLQMEPDPEIVEAGDPLDPNAPTTTEDLRRVALKKLTKMEDQLKSIVEGEKGAEVKAMQDAFRRLTQPKPGPASEMARALAKGDFAEAEKQMEKLLDDIKSGEMKPEDKRQAADQLNQLKDQMEQMAQNQEKIQEQLQSAGFSEEQAKQMASNANQMQQQLDQNQNLSDAQKQQLQKAANAQRKASDAMSSLSQSMGQMAQGMQGSKGQQASEQAGEAMSGQMGSMSQMQSDLAAAKAALGECQGQMAAMGQGLCEGGGNNAFGNGQLGGNNPWKAGNSTSFGKGSGGPGKGTGAGPDELMTDYMLKMEKSAVNTTDGPVIASSLVHGQQVRGESKQAFGSVVSSASADAAEAIDSRQVPREHEQAVRAYFGRLQEQSKEESDG